MNSTEPIINRVEQSGILTLNLEDYYPQVEITTLDMKDFLYMELILKEKEFREKVEQTDWSIYRNQSVIIHCSTDALIPLWAYMVLTTALQPYAHEIYVGSSAQYLEYLWMQNIASITAEDYLDKRIVIKGCGEKTIPAAIYTAITQKLLPVAKSLMYGEACSAVPIYKKKK